MKFRRTGLSSDRRVRDVRSSDLLAYLRPNGPWLLRDVLRAALVVILGAVSSYYLTRWALANAWPTPLAWALPVALDLAALLGIVIVRHAASPEARKAALYLAWGAGGLSVLGNSAMHALDFGAIHITLWTVIGTGAVVPAMIVWGWHVAGGMAARPVVRAPRKPVRGGRSAGKDDNGRRAVVEQRGTHPTPLSSPPPTDDRIAVFDAAQPLLTKGLGWKALRTALGKQGFEVNEYRARQLVTSFRDDRPLHAVNS